MTFELEQVTYCYPRTKKPALEGISLTIPAGKTTAVLGPSGSGKSTLLSLLGLLWEGGLGGGHITYRPGNGAAPRDYSGLSHQERARLRLQEFGFVLQSCYLLPHFTCAQNIAMPLALQGRDPQEREGVVAALLQRADPSGLLAQAMGRLAGAVAGGQKQRVAVLRAVVHNPQVVFADEPFSNLDPRNTRQILQLLEEWRAGKLHPDTPLSQRTLVLVCHSLKTAERLADHFILLEDNHVVGGRTFSRAEWPDRADDIHRLFDYDPAHDDD